MRRHHVPPMVSDLILTALSLFDGVVFDCHDTCRHCGGELTPHDFRTKRFAVIIDGGEQRSLTVLVKRFSCTRCGISSLADEPFYPGTRIGSPVVDLCITLSLAMPCYRASAYLEDIGVVVDRWSVRNYLLHSGENVQSASMFGIRIPLSIISLATLASRLPPGSAVTGSELLEACGDPSGQKQFPAKVRDNDSRGLQ